VIFKWKLGRTEYQIVLRGRYCSLGRTRRLDFGGIEVPEYTLADEILVNGVLHWQRPAPSSPSD
jgi:hypothetical protein